MAATVTIIVALLLAPFSILTLCFAVEVFAGLRRLPAWQRGTAQGWRSVIVVPAHDEESMLPRTLKQLTEEIGTRAHILVVADNCRDGTAALARRLGVEVIERSDERRGKGFALDFARAHLKRDPPDVVIIVDADCTIDGLSIATLIEACGATGRPCQATNLQKRLPGASPPVELSTFAFFIKNVIRQRALQRLAGRVHLLGTGMALPWQIFAQSELATSNITEDLKLGQDLARAGYAPVFIEEATVWSDAETDRNTLSQRRRWEGGFLANALAVGPAMLVRSLREFDLQGLWAAINTMIPPFALLILLDVLALAVGAGLGSIAPAHHWPLLCLSGALILALAALALAWANGGSRFVSLRNLARAPLYVAWKLPMYIKLAVAGAPKEWLRTGR